ncbi:MAG: 30S ribosomal protein S11 [Candidatus Gracilibacteria bacterium]|jgi:small subunit ribosomal protein S11
MAEETKKPEKELAPAAVAEGTAAVEGAAEEKKAVRRSKKKTVTSGKVFVNAGFNNTIITITDPDGAVIAWSTSGTCGFKGSKKATPFAAQMAAENAAEKAKAYGFEKADIFVKGVGHGREQALRGLIAQGIAITRIIDTTPIPHNGCRQPRTRRV